MQSLLSGSAGNCLVVQVGGTAVLVDAGGSRARLADGLRDLDVAPGGLAAILITHEHGDHVAAAGAIARAYEAPIVGNAATLAAARLSGQLTRVLGTGHSLTLGEVEVTSFAVPHDGAEPVGYVLRAEGWTVAVATDLGHAPAEVISHLQAADLIVLEANHDVEMLEHGPYPAFLKARIRGPVGHLSNEQTAETMLELVSGRSQWLWLAHLSAKNNRPRLARQAVEARLLGAGVRTVRVEVLDRYGPGPLLETGRAPRQRRLV